MKKNLKKMEKNEKKFLKKKIYGIMVKNWFN